MGLFNFKKKKETEVIDQARTGDLHSEQELEPNEQILRMQEQVEKSRQAHQFALELAAAINAQFSVLDLQVTATPTKVVSLSGVVDSEKIKADITDLLSGNEEITKVLSFITVFENPNTVAVKVNGEHFEVKTITQLSTLFDKYKAVEDVEYILTGYGEKRIVLHTNKNFAFVSYALTEDGPFYTATNPMGEIGQYQEFVYRDGHKEKYPETWVVSRMDGFQIMRQYLITGKMDEGVTWKSN